MSSYTDAFKLYVDVLIQFHACSTSGPFCHVNCVTLLHSSASLVQAFPQANHLLSVALQPMYFSYLFSVCVCGGGLRKWIIHFPKSQLF